jgi:nicotinamidase-related amidase
MTEEATSNPKPPEGLHYNPEDYTLEEILKPSRSALLVIDMQNDFLSPKGFFANQPHIPGTVDQMQSTVPHIQKLIGAAHKSGVPVIFTKGYEDVKFREGPDIRRAVKWYEKDGDGSVNSESGTWGF